MRNLLRAEEIYILAAAIEGFVFEVVNEAGQTVCQDGVTKWQGGKVQLVFMGRMCFRIDTKTWEVTMVPLSGEQIPAWRPRWSSIGDWLLKKALARAIRTFSEATFKVRRQDYRAMFGKQIETVLMDLADLNEKAEAEAKALRKLDKTHGGTQYHDEVKRMLQMDPDADYDGPTAPNTPASAGEKEYHELGD